jgi:hypothetical protein
MTLLVSKVVSVNSSIFYCRSLLNRYMKVMSVLKGSIPTTSARLKPLIFNEGCGCGFITVYRRVDGSLQTVGAFYLVCLVLYLVRQS